MDGYFSFMLNFCKGNVCNKKEKKMLQEVTILLKLSYNILYECRLYGLTQLE